MAGMAPKPEDMEQCHLADGEMDYFTKTKAKNYLDWVGPVIAPKEPVLVDMLRGGVYAVAASGRAGACPSHWDNGHLARCNDQVTFANLPLVDYPLLLADRTQVPLVAAQSRR